MSVFISPKDYTTAQGAKEITFNIGKRVYSMWCRSYSINNVRNISQKFDEAMNKACEQYNNLPYDYTLVVAGIDAINRFLEDSQKETNTLKATIAKLESENAILKEKIQLERQRTLFSSNEEKKQNEQIGYIEKDKAINSLLYILMSIKERLAKINT
jgi:hypothetical protein